MEAADEFFISDPHNGDISGSLSGASAVVQPASPPSAPGAERASGALRLVSRLPPPGSRLLSPARFQEEARTERGEKSDTLADRETAKRTDGKSKCLGGGRTLERGGSSSEESPLFASESWLSWKVKLVL